MKRNYPHILIDTRKSDGYEYDYVVVVNKDTGFVARVLLLLTDNAYFTWMNSVKDRKDYGITYIAAKCPSTEGGYILEIIDFTNEQAWNGKQRLQIKSLLKKAQKKYESFVSSKITKDDFSIENQITMQELTIERAKLNYGNLVKRAGGNSKIADDQICLAEAILSSLKEHKEIKSKKKEDNA